MFPLFILWVHLIAVIIWMGGMLFEFLVLTPILSRSERPPQGIQRAVTQRFRTIRWISIITVVVTGVMNLLYEGGSARLESDWGGILMIKLFFVAVAIGLSIVFDVVVGGGDGKAAAGAVQSRGRLINFSILILGFVTSFIAIYLTRF